LVAASDANAFFVLKELYPKFGIKDNSIDELHSDHSYETRLFQLYDGTLMLAGNTELIWHRKPIDTKKLQVLSPRERRYPARISPDSATRSLKYHARKLPIYRALQRLRKLLLP